MGIMYLKSAALLVFKLCAYRYDFGLSNELLIIIIAQEAAKLCKSWRSIRDSTPDPFEPLSSK